jgi:ribosomal protein S18 acetylase RimI-like enzyme
MKVRRATPTDAEAIANLYVQLKQHHLQLAPATPRYEMPDEDWLRQTKAALDDPSKRFYVAARGGAVLGFVKLLFEQKSWGLSCEVETLVVDEEAREQGIGSRLMERAEEVARQQGAVAMRVNVLKSNADGRRFYERDGYRPIAVRYGKPL